MNLGLFRWFLGLACLVFFCLGFRGGFSGLACLGFSRKFSGLECLVFLEAFGTGLKGGERQRRFGFTAFRRWPRSSAMLALRGVSPGMPGGRCLDGTPPRRAFKHRRSRLRRAVLSPVPSLSPKPRQPGPRILARWFPGLEGRQGPPRAHSPPPPPPIAPRRMASSATKTASWARGSSRT